jgi:hypothetical protein
VKNRLVAQQFGKRQQDNDDPAIAGHPRPCHPGSPGSGGLRRFEQRVGGVPRGSPIARIAGGFRELSQRIGGAGDTGIEAELGARRRRRRGGRGAPGFHKGIATPPGIVEIGLVTRNLGKLDEEQDRSRIAAIEPVGRRHGGLDLGVVWLGQPDAGPVLTLRRTNPAGGLGGGLQIICRVIGRHG